MYPGLKNLNAANRSKPRGPKTLGKTAKKIAKQKASVVETKAKAKVEGYRRSTLHCRFI